MQMKSLFTLLFFVLPALAEHPQILLDSTTLARIRSKVAAHDADWRAVKEMCDQYSSVNVYWPSLLSDGGNGGLYSGNSGTVVGNCNNGIGNGCQYQGDQLFSAARTLGACYQALAPTDHNKAHKYYKKAKEVIGALTDSPMMVQKGSGPQYYIANRAFAGKAYGTFYWTPAKTGIVAGDSVTISGARGCTNLNGTWTVSAVTGGTIAFDGLPTANANCENKNWYYTRDNNFGARFYGRALSLLYDWFNPELTPDEKAALTSTMKVYSDAIYRLGYGGPGDPETNYGSSWSNFFMYGYAAWQNDDAELANFCQTQWTATMFGPNGQRDYFNRWLSGGGYGEGLEAYGWGSIRSLTEVILTAWTLGSDWRLEPQHWNYVEDQAKYFLQSSKPDRISMDEQEYVYFKAAPNPNNPTLFDPALLYPMSAVLQEQNSTYAPYFQSLIQQFEANSGAPVDSLDRFLYYDSSAPTADPTALSKSYRAWGGNFATSRSDWTSDAVVLHFQGGPSVGGAGNGKTQWESGALAIWNGAQPFVVFGGGERSRSYDILTSQQADQLHNERSLYANRKVSVFAADRPGSNFTKIDGLGNTPVISPGHVSTVQGHPTRIDRAEDAGDYTYYRSSSLVSVNPASLVDGLLHRQGWTRQILFLRPKLIIVYDTTKTLFADDDRAMFWTFGRDLAQVADPAIGMHQFYSTRNAGAIFKGALTTVLPANSSVAIVNHGLMSISGTGASAVAVSGPPLNFLYRVEQRPPAFDHASDAWLNVLDAATSSGAVESITSLKAKNADVVQLSVSGVVGFARGDSPVLPIEYSFVGTPHHRLAGLTPSVAYHVTVGADSTVTVAAATGSGDSSASAAGILSYDSSGTALPMPPIVTTSVLPNGVANSAYSQSLTANGDAPITWTTTAGALPSGMTLNASTGAITGIPDATGTTKFTVRATNGTGASDKALSIVVGLAPLPPPGRTVDSGDQRQGQPPRRP